MIRGVYYGRLKLLGQEHEETLRAALNYAVTLNGQERFKEAKALFRKTMPVARRVLGESKELTLKMRWYYARALYNNDDATLDDLRKAVTTLGDLALTVRRVFGGSNPLTTEIDDDLREARAALRARETSPGRK